MSRYERKVFFEKLIALREAYRADRHERTGLTIDQAIDFAAQAYDDAVAADVAAAATISAKGNPAAF